MNKLFILIITVIFFGCATQEKQQYTKAIEQKTTELDSLKKHYPDALKPLTTTNWVEKYSTRIMKDNINFKLDSTKVLSYFIVPLLLIPDEILIKDTLDLLCYLPQSKLTIDGAECYVLEDEIPVATFSLYRKNLFPATPRIFKNYIRERSIGDARNSKLYFKICIKTDYFKAFIPGIVFLSGEENFQFLNYSDNKIYPVKELYRTLFDNEEHFRQYLNKLVKE